MSDLPPPPITKLNFEQEFTLATFTKSLEGAPIDVLEAGCSELFKQNILLRATIANLIAHWNK